MLLILAFIFLALWALGLMSSYTMGGFLNILFIVALALAWVRVIFGPRALR